MNKDSYSSIMYRNVAYKEYLDIKIENQEDAIKDFIETCEKYNLFPNGPITFTITQITLDKHINLEVYMPVSKSFLPNEHLNFRSYWQIQQMLHGRIIGSNYVEEDIKVLNELVAFGKENNLIFSSPYYHTIQNKYKNSWVDVKVRVSETT